MPIQSYTHKPINVKAIQYIGTKESANEIIDCLKKEFPNLINTLKISFKRFNQKYNPISINTGECGWRDLYKNDYLVINKNEYWKCEMITVYDKETFEDTYNVSII